MADLVAVAAHSIGWVLRLVTILCHMALFTTVATRLRRRPSVVGAITGEMTGFTATAALDTIC